MNGNAPHIPQPVRPRKNSFKNSCYISYIARSWQITSTIPMTLHKPRHWSRSCRAPRSRRWGRRRSRTSSASRSHHACRRRRRAPARRPGSPARPGARPPGRGPARPRRRRPRLLSSRGAPQPQDSEITLGELTAPNLFIESADEGEYVFELIVTNDKGLVSDAEQVTVSISNDENDSLNFVE